MGSITISSPEKRRYRQVEIPAIPSAREADFSGLEEVACSNPEQLDIEQLSGKRQL
jgi:hypothetical protein